MQKQKSTGAAQLRRGAILPISFAGVAQLVEQLICNQQVGGSSPSTSSIKKVAVIGGFFL